MFKQCLQVSLSNYYAIINTGVTLAVVYPDINIESTYFASALFITVLLHFYVLLLVAFCTDVS